MRDMEKWCEKVCLSSSSALVEGGGASGKSICDLDAPICDLDARICDLDAPICDR